MPLRRYHHWIAEIIPVDTAAPVSALTIDGGMDAHGHGLPSRPQARSLGDGRFEITGMLFNMSGEWRLVAAFSNGVHPDRATFSILLQP
ncbi:MAG: hypothetical protein AAF515_10360 [Pseudomonadota bacterium]